MSSSIRRVIVPAEHGAWGFLAEPLLLGLVVAFSVSGLLLAAAVTLAFLARQPLKLIWTDRRRGRRYPRTVVAERALLGLGLAAGATVAATLALAGPAFLIPLAIAAPAGALALVPDLANRVRTWPSELAAPTALTASAAAVTLAGGWPLAPALGLWGMVLTRAIPSVFYVRARLRLERGLPSPVLGAGLAQGAGLLAAFFLATRELAPWLGLAAVIVLTVRAAVGLSPLRRPTTARRVGFTELGYGALFVAAVAVGIHLGF